jgi:hypothetical protein
MSIVVYTTSVSSSLDVKKKQQKLTLVLDGLKVPYTVVDIGSK